jgi:hypothetical protein
MKSVLVPAWPRVAAWAGFHRRTHPAFSGQALSMVGVLVVKGQGAWQFMSPVGQLLLPDPRKILHVFLFLELCTEPALRE